MESKAYKNPNYGDLTNLDVEKLQELDTILTSILALPVTKDAFSQIISGKPTRTPFSDAIKAERSFLHETIIDSDDAKLSDHAMRVYENIRKAFTPQGLKIDLNVHSLSLMHAQAGKPNSKQLAQRYQDTPFGSPEHRLRLLEIVAASVNTLAGMVFISFHNNTDIKPATPKEGHYWQFRETDRFYVNFYHSQYQRLDDYPFGLLNVVGYWAEAEVFGGVVLFEQDKSGTEVLVLQLSLDKIVTNRGQIINAFIHPQVKGHAFELSDKQLESFASLGVPDHEAKSSSAESILPFIKEPSARTEPTFGIAGKEPLRIYKNDYDKQPIAYITEESRCVFRKDDKRAAIIEKTMKRMKEEGWDQEARAAPHRPFASQPSSLSAFPPAEEATSSSIDDPPSADKKNQ